MKLYLLRHAIAESRATTGQDRDRKLTAEGITRLQRVLTVAAGANVKPGIILSSPYVRARHTAELAAAALGFHDEITYSVALTPDATPQSAWDEIRLMAAEEEVLVVSHDPLISSLLSYVLGLSQYIHSFKKAGLARIDLRSVGPRPAGELLWILTPALATASIHAED